MSFFRRAARGARSQEDHPDAADPERSSKTKLSISSGKKKQAERTPSRLALEEAETRLSLAQEELRLCRETLSMRQAEHKTRMELLNLQLEALTNMAANKGTGAPTTVTSH